MNPADAFTQAMADAGMVPPATVHADGALHRFSPTGKRGDLAGWYVLHADGLPAGVFGCWRTGLVQTWCAKPDNALTAAEREALRRRVQQAKAQRDAAENQRREQARTVAAQCWNGASPVQAQGHAYLLAKGVQAHGLRASPGHAGADGLLLVPLRDTAGTLHSLQTITPDGHKRFLPGGRVRGCYHAMGKPAGVLVVCEGYATAASIHEATGLAVAAAFSASNLAPVASALHRQYPAQVLVVAADDDWRTDGNPGMSAARQAAMAVSGLLVVPQFPAHRSGETDFNDLHQLAGLDAVRACFAEVLEGMTQ